MLRFLPVEHPLSRLWEAVGLSKSGHEGGMRNPDNISLRRLCSMADEMRVPRLRFLEVVLEEEQKAHRLSPPPKDLRTDEPLRRPRKPVTGWYPRSPE